MADTATITVGGGNSASITVQQQAVLSAVIPDVSSSVSVEVFPMRSPSFEVSVPSTSFEVSSRVAVVATVKEQFNTITVAAAVPAAGATRLRDLEDVKGDPTSGQILVYNVGENNFQFQDQNAGGAGGDDLTDEAITVTNTDAAFSSISGFTFETGTSITTVLSNILNPYAYSTLSISNLSATINGSSGSISSNKVLEVGSSVVVNNITYVVTNSSQIKDNTLALLKNGQISASNLTESSSTENISPITESSSVPVDVSFKLTAVDEGSSVSAEKSVFSDEIKFQWRFSTRLSSASAAPSSNADATALYDNSSDSVNVADPGSGSINLNCTASNSNVNNFTFIMVPESFGTLKSVILNNSTDVTSDFVQVTSSTFTATNDHDIGVSYFIYKTNDPGAFSDSSTLTIKFN